MSGAPFTSTLNRGEAYSLYTRKELDFAPVESAFQLGKNAYVNESYEMAVDTYNQSMAALKNVMSILLLHRAAAYEMQGKYNRVVNDCMEAEQKQTAVCPDIYFARASGYYFQHQFRMVLDSLEQGIIAVPAICSTRSVLLQKREQMIKEISWRNQSTIRALPYDILSHILSFTRTSDQIQLSLTCRSWERFMIHEWRNMWRTVDSEGFCTDMPPTSRFLSRIPQKRVRALVLHFDYFNLRQNFSSQRISMNDSHNRNPSEIHSSNIYWHSIENQWNCIESLTIHGLCHTLLSEVLRLNCNTIREITLFRDKELISDVQLMINLVTEYPNLRSLTAHFVGKLKPGIQQSLKIPKNTPRSRLTKLSLDCDMTEESFSVLLKSCPDLVNLRIRWGHTLLSPVLALIREHCKRLEIFTFGTYAIPSDLTHQVPDQTPGIKELAISFDNGFQKVSGLSTNEMLEQLNMLLGDNQNSLRTLKLCGRLLGLPEHGENIYGLLAQHTFPNLLEFKFKLYDTAWCPADSRQLLHQFISSCPSLHTAEIIAPYIIFDEQVMKGLGSLTQLRSISLSVLDAIAHRTIAYPYTSKELPDWGHFLTKNMEFFIQKASKLQKLSLDFPLVGSTHNSDTILTSITKSIAVHSPAISELCFYGISVSTPTFHGVLNNLKRTKVKRLSLPVPLEQSLTTQEIRVLASLECLRELSLFDRNERFTEFDLSALLEECQIHPQLIVVCINSGGVNYLKGHKPEKDLQHHSSRGGVSCKYTIEDLRIKGPKHVYGFICNKRLRLS